METTVATAFGQRVEVQNGEASELVDAAAQVVFSLKDKENFGLLEVILMLCKLSKHFVLETVFCTYVHTCGLKL